MAILHMKNITKSFPGVVANDSISLSVKKGEIHALLGENGAGKTTLMNILFGLYQADEGSIMWDEKPVCITSPDEAIQLGIGMVHQHFMLVDTMTVLQNILLGLKEDGYPLFRKHEAKKRVNKLLSKYGFQMDLDACINELSVGNQQRVEIIKALYRDAKLLILDEPTAVLTPQETKEFFQIIKKLKDHGHSIILISHILSDIMSVSDRVTVLRDGKTVFRSKTSDTTENELSHHMVGREIVLRSYAKCKNGTGENVLTLDNVSLEESKKTLLKNISFGVKQNEVLGVAGVDGNGQTELAEVITGIRKPSSGKISLGEVNLQSFNIRERTKCGLAYIAADRHRDALVLEASVLHNLHLKNFHKSPYAKLGVLNKSKLSTSSQNLISEYNIKTPSINEKVRSLSGGNQQKIVLAREFDLKAKIIIACQPTRGLDIGATAYVRDSLIDFRDRGGSVILISTDLNEILSMSDRIVVLYRGLIMGIVDVSQELSVDTIGMMMGGTKLEEVEW